MQKNGAGRPAPFCELFTALFPVDYYGDTVLVETRKNAVGAGGLEFWLPFAVGRAFLGNKTQYLLAKDDPKGMTLGELVLL